MANHGGSSRTRKKAATAELRPAGAPPPRAVVVRRAVGPCSFLLIRAHGAHPLQASADRPRPSFHGATREPLHAPRGGHYSRFLASSPYTGQREGHRFSPHLPRTTLLNCKQARYQLQQTSPSYNQLQSKIHIYIMMKNARSQPFSTDKKAVDRGTWKD